MPDIFQVEGSNFIKILDKQSIKDKQNISLLDIFEAYIEAAMQSSNAVSPHLLRSLVFKQFQNYGDYDRQVRETVQTVSDITQSTGDVLHAIENDNKEHIQDAYNKLKTYKSRMCDIEDAFYLDEHTKLFNRKYLFIKNLDDKLAFKSDGMLFSLHIVASDALEDLYGSIVLRSVLKKFALTANKALEICKVPLIRYDTNEFIILADAKNHEEIHKTLDLLRHTFEIKKFKLTGSKTLAFNFMATEVNFSKGMLFEDVYISVGKGYSLKVIGEA